MWDNIDVRDRDRSGATPSSARPRPSIIAPSPDVWAIIKFGVLPTSPPHELEPYTIRVDDDWVLTNDALAFGESFVIGEFLNWRTSWERTWRLEPASSIIRLLDLATHLDPDPEAPGSRLERLMAPHRRDDGVVLPPSTIGECRSALSDLADLVRARAEHGYGVVDTTPGTDRVGLARAWSAWGDADVIAAVDGIEVVLEPSTGLQLRSSNAGHAWSPLVAISHVESDGDRCLVSSETETVTFASSEARPLSWLVPGATAWRVRRIPEIVAWAKTFTGLDECLDQASNLALPVRLTTRRPIADVSAITETA